MTANTVAQDWREKTCAYAKAINTYVEKGLSVGWEKAGKEPSTAGVEKIHAHVPVLLEALRAANGSSPRDDIKSQWPISYEALGDHLQNNGQSILMLCVLPDGSILARIGAIYEPGKVVHIVGDEVNDVAGVEYFGRCPGRRYFAVTTTDGVSVTDGWQGSQTAFCPWPNGMEGIPAGVKATPLETPPRPTQLIPFPDGSRVLLVSSVGIFVLTPQGASRLRPTKEEIQENYEWLQKEYPEDEYDAGLSMEHGAISPDGSLIAVGAQDGHHMVFDASLHLIAEIGPHSEYPHYALFSADGKTAAFNACHFYNGATVAIATAKLPGFESDFYEEAKGLKVIESQSRVYAGVSRKDEFIFGDAYGYLRAVGHDGTYRWQHFIGSTLSGLDLSDDGRTLVASTFAGFISIIELDAGRQQPYQIGNGNHFEHRRWLFWKEEQTPLAW